MDEEERSWLIKRTRDILNKLSPNIVQFLVGYENPKSRDDRLRIAKELAEHSRGGHHTNLPPRPKSERWVGGLRSVEFKGKDFNQQKTAIGWYIHEVGENSYCIRQASSIFIGTAYYYLRLFLHERIPNFKPEAVAHIM